MAEQSFIQVRIDDKLKRDALAVLDEIGMDMPNAIRMFLKRIVLERGLPFDAKLPAEQPAEDGAPFVEYIPAKPAMLIPIREWVALLCTVPAGRITRMVDIEAYFCGKYGVSRVELEQKPIPYDPEIPWWRVVSTRGMLQEVDFRCSKEKQLTDLTREGLTVVPSGPNNRSLKVDDYQKLLFKFN